MPPVSVHFGVATNKRHLTNVWFRRNIQFGVCLLVKLFRVCTYWPVALWDDTEWPRINYQEPIL